MKKKILIGIIGLVVIVIGVVCLILLLPKDETYRSIKVFKIEGTVEVSRNSEVFEAYEQMMLKNNDEVSVGENESLILKLDSDKYICLDENTKIKLISSEKDSSKTVIELKEGKIIGEVKEKLKDGETFEVETPNSVMAIRGTTFSVEVDEETEEYEVTYQVVDGVIEVLVFDQTTGSTKVNSVSIESEECAKVSVDKSAYIDSDSLKDLKDQALTGEIPVNEYDSVDNYINSSDEVVVEKGEYEDSDFDGLLDLTEYNYRIITVSSSFSVKGTNIAGEHLYENSEKFTVTITADEVEGKVVNNWLVNGKILIIETQDSDEVPSIIELEVNDKLLVEVEYKDIDINCEHDFQTEIVESTCTKHGTETSICSKCGEIESVTELPLKDHSFGEWYQSQEYEDKHERECKCGELETENCTFDEGKVTKEPTHTEEGIKTYTCTECGRIKEESVEKTEGHEFGEWYQSQKYEDKHERECKCGELETGNCTFDEGKVTKEPTHTEEGIKTYTCTECGRIKEEPVEKTEGHEFGEWYQSKEYEDKHERVCKCGELETGNCTFDEGKITKDPTHTEEGIKTYTCTGCGRTKEEPVEKTEGHEFGEWIPDEVEEDKHYRECLCGELETGSCTFDEGKVTKEPTHTEEGIITYTCTECGRTKEEPVEKTEGHEFGEWTPDEVEEDKHYRECLCGELETGDCEFTENSSDNGLIIYTCTICGREKETSGITIVVYGGTATFEGKETVKFDTAQYGEKANVYIAQADDVLNVSLTNQEGRTFKHWVSGAGTIIPDEQFSMLVLRSGYYYPVFEDTDLNDFSNREKIFEGNCEEGTLYMSTNSKGDVKYELEFVTGGYHASYETTPYNSQYHKHECSVCGEVIYEKHEEMDREVIKPSTHTEEGQMKYECNCGYEWYEVIPTTEEHSIDYDEWDIIEKSENGEYGKYRVHCQYCDYYEEYWYLNNDDLSSFLEGKMINYQYTYGGKVCHDEYYYSYTNEKGEKVYIWAIQYESERTSNKDNNDTYIFMYIDDEDSTTIEPIYLSKSRGDKISEYLWAIYGYAYDVNDWIKTLDSPDYNIGCGNGMLLSNSMSARSSVFESYHDYWAETYNDLRIPTSKEYNDLSNTSWEISYEGKGFQGGYYENEEYVTTGGRDVIWYVKDAGTSYKKYMYVDKETGITYGYEDLGTYYRTVFIMRTCKEIVSPEEFEKLDEAGKSVVYSYGDIENDIKSLCSKRTAFNNFTLTLPETTTAFRFLFGDYSDNVEISYSNTNEYYNNAHVYNSGYPITLTWQDNEGVVFDRYEIWDFESRTWVTLSESPTYTFNTSTDPVRDAVYARVIYHEVDVPIEPGETYQVTVENGYFYIDGEEYTGTIEVAGGTTVNIYSDYIEGKTFEYWVDGDGNQYSDYSITINSDMVLTAVYTDATYTVYVSGWDYNSYVSVNGGEQSYTGEFTGKIGDTFEISSFQILDSEYNVFMGWYIETNVSGSWEYLFLSETQTFTYEITGKESGSIYGVWTTGENPFTKKYVDIRMENGFVIFGGGEVISDAILENAYSVISVSKSGRATFFDDPTDETYYKAWDVAFRYEIDGEINHNYYEEYDNEYDFYPAECWIDNPEYSYPDGVINVSGYIMTGEEGSGEVILPS